MGFNKVISFLSDRRLVIGHKYILVILRKYNKNLSELGFFGLMDSLD